MSWTADDVQERRRPPAPVPREEAPSVLALLWALRHNPLEAWTREHFERSIVLSSSALGHSAMVCDPSAIRRVLVENVDNYRKDELQRRLLAPALGNGLLTSGGEAWKSQRRRFAPLFTPRMVESFAPAMAHEAGLLASRWKAARRGRPLDVAEEMGRVMLNVLEHSLFSGGLGLAPREFMQAASHYFDTQGRVDPFDVLGAPDWLPRIGQIRARPVLKFFTKAVAAVIAARLKALADNPNDGVFDLLTALLQAREAETGQGMTEAEVAANIITFIGAGYETPANTLSWALFLLAFDETWRLRMEREADQEMPDGEFIAGTLDRFVITRAFIEETMRLYPPVSIISRQAIGGDVLAGQPIKPGTIVVLAPWVLHRHRLLWDSPEHFAPSRFLGEARNRIDKFAYLPFGAGPRVCIGASFAMQEMIIMLATIARHFRLDMAEGEVVRPVHRITLRPEGGLRMILRQRSPC